MEKPNHIDDGIENEKPHFFSELPVGKVFKITQSDHEHFIGTWRKGNGETAWTLNNFLYRYPNPNQQVEVLDDVA